jgi:hypothetical protein
MMADTPLVKKLLIKPNTRIAILNAPEGFREQLGALPEGVAVSEQPGEGFDLVQLFVKSIAELEQHFAAARDSLKKDGILWVAHPKKTGKIKTDISRDVGWDTANQAGWGGVALISIDDTWSSMRLKPGGHGT